MGNLSGTALARTRERKIGGSACDAWCDGEGWVRPKMMGADTVYGSTAAAAADPKADLAVGLGRARLLADGAGEL